MKDANRQKLVAQINAVIAAYPHEHRGRQWCAMPQHALAQQCGFSVATLKELIRHPPFVRKRAKLDKDDPHGPPMCLLRVGEPDPDTREDFAVWARNYIGKVVRRQAETVKREAERKLASGEGQVVWLERHIKQANAVLDNIGWTPEARKQLGVCSGIYDAFGELDVDLKKQVIKTICGDWQGFAACVKFDKLANHEAKLIEAEQKAKLQAIASHVPFDEGMMPKEACPAPDSAPKFQRFVSPAMILDNPGIALDFCIMKMQWAGKASGFEHLLMAQKQAAE